MLVDGEDEGDGAGPFEVALRDFEARPRTAPEEDAQEGRGRWESRIRCGVERQAARVRSGIGCMAITARSLR